MKKRYANFSYAYVVSFSCSVQGFEKMHTYILHFKASRATLQIFAKTTSVLSKPARWKTSVQSIQPLEASLWQQYSKRRTVLF